MRKFVVKYTRMQCVEREREKEGGEGEGEGEREREVSLKFYI